jgi:hypothetical protein
MASSNLNNNIYHSIGSDAPDGWKTGYVLALLILGVVFMIAFVFWELHVENPLIPMSIFKNRDLSVVRHLLGGTNYILNLVASCSSSSRLCRISIIIVLDIIIHAKSLAYISFKDSSSSFTNGNWWNSRQCTLLPSWNTDN